LLSKVLKNPDCAEYRQSVAELDEREYINLRLCCRDMRNNYVTVHDILCKNLEKIRRPRSDKSLAGY
jgi:proteasome activator subunit 3 (PA28 gamma)